MSAGKSFSTEVEGDALIVVLRGSASGLGGGDARADLDLLLEQLQDPELSHVVIDMSEVSYFGTMMLGAMRMIWQRVADGGGQMALCNVSVVGREILRVSGFDSIWPIHDSRRAALDEVCR